MLITLTTGSLPTTSSYRQQQLMQRVGQDKRPLGNARGYMTVRHVGPSLGQETGSCCEIINRKVEIRFRIGGGQISTSLWHKTILICQFSQLDLRLVAPLESCTITSSSPVFLTSLLREQIPIFMTICPIVFHTLYSGSPHTHLQYITQ